MDVTNDIQELNDPNYVDTLHFANSKIETTPISNNLIFNVQDQFESNTPIKSISDQSIDQIEIDKWIEQHQNIKNTILKNIKLNDICKLFL